MFSFEEDAEKESVPEHEDCRVWSETNELSSSYVDLDLKSVHKELPLRIHDQGVLHRNELSGALAFDTYAVLSGRCSYFLYRRST